MPNGEPRDDSSRTAQIVGGIAVLAALLALGYFFWPAGEEPAEQPDEGAEPAAVEEAEPTAPPEPELEMPARVSEYVELAREPYVAPEGRAKYDHEYTAKRLRALGEALVAFGGLLDDADGGIERTRETLKGHAEAIQVDWRDDTHADDVRDAFQEAADAFRTLSDRVNGGEEAPELREQARTIDPETLYLDQKSRAEAFFASTADRFEALFEALERQRNGAAEGEMETS